MLAILYLNLYFIPLSQTVISFGSYKCDFKFEKTKDKTKIKDRKKKYE